MNNPLRYQMTEYDCGPTSMLTRSAIWRFRWSLIILRSITASCPFGIGKRMCGMSMRSALLKAVKQSSCSMSERC